VAARVKVDENLLTGIGELLKNRGLDAVTVVAQGWHGLADEDLWERVQAEGRWLVTSDKGFGDLRLYPPGTHAGVILLRSAEESLGDYLQLAAMALERVKLDEIAGAVIVVTRRGVHIRRAP
jgi:predicted nuclease of predicted toxin-antitoxin system